MKDTENNAKEATMGNEKNQVGEITGPGAARKALVKATKQGESARYFVGTVSQVTALLGSEYNVEAI